MSGVENQNQQSALEKNLPKIDTSGSESGSSSVSSSGNIQGILDVVNSVKKESMETAEKISIKTAKEKTNEILKENLPKYTETLGVFVALFTFVSIQVQVFSKVSSLGNAIIFTFLIFLCMIGFLFMLHWVISIKSGSIKESVASTLIPLVSLSIVILTGFFLVFYLKNNDILLDKQESKYVEEFREKLIKHDSDIEYLKLQYFK